MIDGMFRVEHDANSFLTSWLQSVQPLCVIIQSSSLVKYHCLKHVLMLTYSHRTNDAHILYVTCICAVRRLELLAQVETNTLTFMVNLVPG